MFCYSLARAEGWLERQAGRTEVSATLCLVGGGTKMPRLQGKGSPCSSWAAKSRAEPPGSPPVPTDVLVLGGLFYGLMRPLHSSAGAGGVTSSNIGTLRSRQGEPVRTSVLCAGPGACGEGWSPRDFAACALCAGVQL